MRYKDHGSTTRDADCECAEGFHFENVDQRACVPNRSCSKGYGQGEYGTGICVSLLSLRDRSCSQGCGQGEYGTGICVSVLSLCDRSCRENTVRASACQCCHYVQPACPTCLVARAVDRENTVRASTYPVDLVLSLRIYSLRAQQILQLGLRTERIRYGRLRVLQTFCVVYVQPACPADPIARTMDRENTVRASPCPTDLQSYSDVNIQPDAQQVLQLGLRTGRIRYGRLRILQTLCSHCLANLRNWSCSKVYKQGEYGTGIYTSCRLKMSLQSGLLEQNEDGTNIFMLLGTCHNYSYWALQGTWWRRYGKSVFIILQTVQCRHQLGLIIFVLFGIDRSVTMRNQEHGDYGASVFLLCGVDNVVIVRIKRTEACGACIVTPIASFIDKQRCKYAFFSFIFLNCIYIYIYIYIFLHLTTTCSCTFARGVVGRRCPYFIGMNVFQQLQHV